MSHVLYATDDADAIRQAIQLITEQNTDNLVVDVKGWPLAVKLGLFDHFGKYIASTGNDEITVNAKSFHINRAFENLLGGTIKD